MIEHSFCQAEADLHTSMRSECNGVEALGLPQFVQSEQIGVDVVGVVGVGGVVLQIPLGWGLHVLCWPPLWLALVIHHV